MYREVAIAETPFVRNAAYGCVYLQMETKIMFPQYLIKIQFEYINGNIMNGCWVNTKATWVELYTCIFGVEN